MEVGLVTPWDVPHGVAEYARDLVEALSDEVRLHVVGFDLANGKADFDTDVAVEELGPCRLVHIQHDDGLYQDGHLEALVTALKKAGKKTVVTAHGEPPLTSSDCLIVHQIIQSIRHQNVAQIPHGFQFRADSSTVLAPPRTVCVIGSKSNVDPVAKALDKIGGGALCVVTEWKPREDLVKMILNNQVVVINYPMGSRLSLAAVLACSIARPLLVSVSGAFTHVKEFPGVATFLSESRLALDMDFTFANYVQAIAFARDRVSYADKKDLGFKSFVQRHIDLYRKILQ